MTYVRDQTGEELRAHMNRLKKMPGWHEPLADRLFKEILQLDAERQEAANIIDGLVASLETADKAINASYAQAQAEWQHHDSVEDKCDATIREWREKRDCALAAVQGNTEGES